MSYFIFGWLHDHSREVYGDSRILLRSSLEACAVAAGLRVDVDSVDEPAILEEMREPYLDAGIRFLLKRSASDDTSDGIISPHLLGLPGAVCGARMVGEWVDCVLGIATKDSRMQILVTEGYDDAFEEVGFRRGEIGHILASRIEEQFEVPSLKFTLDGR